MARAQTIDLDAFFVRFAENMDRHERWQAETDRIIQETAEQMKETDRRMKETDRIVQETAEQMKETDRKMKETTEQMKETDRRMQETDRRMQETDRRMQETDRQLGGITNRFGEMLEYMVMPNLVLRFEELGFTFTKANRTKITDKGHDIFLEIDALLENGDKVMAVEVKNKPSTDDVDRHLKRMEKLRQYADLHGDKRVYMAAMAGAVFHEGVKIYALEHGLYALEPSGETFMITEPRGNYHPREWCLSGGAG